MWALDEGYAVGLLANSLMLGLSGESASASDVQEAVMTPQSFIHRVRVPLASESGQRVRILSALGRLLPYFGSPMDTLIDAERFTLPLGTTVVLVSAAEVLQDTTIENLVDLRSRGAVVSLALTGDAESKVGAETYDVPVHRLGGREVWHELVKHVGDEEHTTIGRSTAALHLD